MKKVFFAAALVLAATAFAPAVKGQESKAKHRDTREFHDKHVFGLAGGWSCNMSVERGMVAGLSYDQCLKGIWWLGLEANITATRTITTSDPAVDTTFLPQELVGVNVKFGPRFEWDYFYIYPTILAGVGMVAQNRVLFQDITVPQSLPFLCPQIGGRVEFGAQLGAICLGVYASYLQQFAQLQPFRLNGADLQAEWLTRNPFQAGASLSLAIDKGVRHHGGNDVAIAEGFGLYGTNGWETGCKIIFNRNTGAPWLQKKEEDGFRNEDRFSQQYGVRFSETLGKENRTTAQIGYSLLYHKGPKAPVLYRLSLWAGLGEAGHSSSFGIDQENGSYEGSLSALQTGFKGNAEVDISFRIPSVRRFYISLLGGVSYTRVFGTQVSGTVSLTSATFESPVGFYAGIGAGFAF